MNRYSALRVPCFGFGLLLLGCSTDTDTLLVDQTDQIDQTDTPVDMHVPAGTALADLLPTPTAVDSIEFAPSQHFQLRPSQLAASLSTPGIARVNALGTVDHHPDSSWVFAVGAQELEVVLGTTALRAVEVTLAEHYGALLSRAETREALEKAVTSFPMWKSVETAGAWDLQGLRIESVSVDSSAASDSDGDGAYETPQTLLTMTMTLPSLKLRPPSEPFPSCQALLSDAADYATSSDSAYVTPADASWDYQLTLNLHFYITGLEDEHALAQTKKGYLTKAQAAAAGTDLGIIEHFLSNHLALEVPAFDLAVGFGPTAKLRDETLGVVSGLARARGEVDCLREIDAWDNTASVLVPNVTPAMVSGEEVPSYLLHTYNEALDAMDDVVDPGLSCLHDADGNALQVGDTLACSSASGALDLITVATQTAQRGGTSVQSESVSVLTPYQRLVQQQAAKDTLDLKLGGFDWTCTAAKNQGYCTERFGRGIRVCMSEWVIHNQVGDYWNIHYTQCPWKAQAQVTIKGGAYVIRAWLATFFGSANVAMASESLSLLGDVVDNGSHTHIAGYTITGAKAFAGVIGMLKNGVHLKDLRNAGVTFALDKVVDGLAQAAEVTAVGWQDYSYGSHCRCGFEFRNPDYCD